jgi:diguanylate cyclase (GGDEF)-like protein
MQALVRLLHLLLPKTSPHPALIAWLARHSYAVRGVSAVLLLSVIDISTRRISDAIIGVSCIAIAVTLGNFISSAPSSASPKLRFRRSLIGFTFCAALAGVAALFAATAARSFHPRLVAQTSLAVALLAVISAVLLPYVLSQVLAQMRAQMLDKPDSTDEGISAALTAATVTARKFEARFLAAATGTTDAIYLLEPLRAPDGRMEDFLFTYLNANAEKIIGKGRLEVLGARITRILPMGSAGKLFQQYCEVVRTGKPLIHEFPLIPKDPYGPWMRHEVARIPISGQPSSSDSEAEQDTGLMVTARDITAQKHALYDLNSPTQHDALTGLPNRHLLEDRIEQAIARANRYANKVAILILNVDGMQQINARYGRAFGDRVLRTTASRLRAAIRATDTIVHLDADEFIVVLPEMMQVSNVRRTAATLLATLRNPIDLEVAPNPALNSPPNSPPNSKASRSNVNGPSQPRTLQISASLGAALYPDSAGTVADLLTAADIAMCRAKTQGKNQYVLFNPGSDPQALGKPGLAPKFSHESAAKAQQRAG